MRTKTVNDKMNMQKARISEQCCLDLSAHRRPEAETWPERNIKISYILLAVMALLFWLAPSSHAQNQIVFRLAPNLSLLQIETRDDTSLGNRWHNTFPVGAGVGLSADIFLIKSKLALGTGVWYTVKGFGLSSNAESHVYNDAGTISYYLDAWKYNLHYVQVPLTLKYFIPNKSGNSRYYIQAGLTFDWKIAEQALKKDKNYFYQLSIQAYNKGDIFNANDKGLFLALGKEWKVSQNRWFFAGLSFTKGIDRQLSRYFLFEPGINLAYSTGFRFSSIAIETGLKINVGKK
jgi:Outer membrane protein beta-barrel domain